ncbi:MAG: pyridoxal-phosphate dependent enzyme [Anaerolineae bacterium]|nr:pyridoxal-phosphate dependent enzyme [Anaerolineae bacterium]
MLEMYLSCDSCGWQELYLRTRSACPRCGNDLLDMRYDYARARILWDEEYSRRPFGMWRYQELLPLRDAANRVTMGEGGTPLFRAVNTGMMLGLRHLYVKDERQGPTGSFKDRQASLAISVLREMGVTEAVLASTGNVAISYSAYSTHAGIKLWAFLPSMVPAEKMREIALYGTEVIKVAGTYDQAKQVAADFVRTRGLHYDRGFKSIAARESMKTLGFEVAEQLARVLGPGPGAPLQTPDWYFQSVSGGMGPVGFWKAFQEMREMGLVTRLPKLANVQVAGCAPMVDSFSKGLAVAEPVLNPQTLISTISTGNPGAAYPFLRDVVVEHGGAFVKVEDEEAFRAMHVMAKMDGISMEPAAATAFAGLFKMASDGRVKPDDVIVVNCSGHTFPVEKFLLGDDWERSVQVATASGAAPEAREEGLLASLEHLDGRTRKVAIIEDNLDSARLLRRVLQAQGEYQIEEAHDGRSGLHMVRENVPDLILLDLMMPELDGFSVLDALKRGEQLRDVPVIVVTAVDLSAAEKRRLEGKVHRTLQKGTFLSTDILADIDRVLSSESGE